MGQSWMEERERYLSGADDKLAEPKHQQPSARLGLKSVVGRVLKKVLRPRSKGEI